MRLGPHPVNLSTSESSASSLEGVASALGIDGETPHYHRLLKSILTRFETL